MKKRLIPSILLVLSASAAMGQLDAGHLAINEIMQSNVDCIMDDLNEFPDSWVELYNASPSLESLATYSIGTERDASTAWPLPDDQVYPHGFCLVYCDKVATGLHTDFRLESGKDCTLYLFKDGQLLDSLPSGMKKQPAPNISFGRATKGGSWGYQLTPTPGAENTGQTCSHKDILPAPLFSVAGRVMQENETISLKLSLPADAPEGTEIRYTTDCSEPTAESTLFDAPVLIDKTTTVRAKLFCQGYLSPLSTTQSYIMLGHESTLPVVALTTDSRYLYDDEIGIYVEGNGATPNYKNDWRRPMNIEVFDGNLAESCINQVGEFRIHGGGSREFALKSLVVYANKRFGEKRLAHEFFPEQRPGQTAFKSLVLRNAGNDHYYFYMRDGIIQSHVPKYLDLDHQAYRPAIAVINGEYKGILNIRERSNEDNIFTNYNGLEDIDLVENLVQIKQGTLDNWNAFVNFYHQEGHTWEEFDELIDLEEYRNLMIAQIFFNNLDFSSNNIIWWRPREEGGRWRTIMKDVDYTLSLYNQTAEYQYISWLYDSEFDPVYKANTPEGTLLFRRLMEIERFRNDFIDRFAISMGDFMNCERIWETWEPMINNIKTERDYHAQVNQTSLPGKAYERETQRVKDWIKDRENFIYQHLGDFYHVGEPKPFEINNLSDDAEQANIRFNGFQLSRGEFNGKFFAERDITLESEEECSWVVSVKYPTKTIKEQTVGTSFHLTIPTDCESVTVTVADPTDVIITDIGSATLTTPSAVYTICGQRLNHSGNSSTKHLAPGIYIVNNKKIMVK